MKLRNAICCVDKLTFEVHIPKQSSMNLAPTIECINLAAPFINMD